MDGTMDTEGGSEASVGTLVILGTSDGTTEGTIEADGATLGTCEIDGATDGKIEGISEGAVEIVGA